MPEPRPLRCTRWANLFHCDAEWEADGEFAAYVWEPLDIDAPADARPLVNSFSIQFYSGGNPSRPVGEARCHHFDYGGENTLLCLGTATTAQFYAITSGRCVYRDGRWYMRWWCHRNTRVAQAANAALAALRLVNQSTAYPDEAARTAAAVAALQA